MSTSGKPNLYLPYLYSLLGVKFGLHLLATLNGYGLHRDEYLYLAEGAYPMWGYMEGPPMIGWVAAISTNVLGSSIWAAKLPVLLVGLLSIWFLLHLVRELGGDKYAQLIAGVGWLLSPVFLGSNNLFQPVSFNQFCWLLLGLAWVRVINYQRPKDWYLLGLVAGIGLLTKYSIAFYMVSLGIGMLLTPQRKLFKNRYLWLAAGIALLIWSPNLYWQYSYDFPVVLHMQELASTQLVNMTFQDFIVPQLLYHFAGLFVWAPGLYFLLTHKKLAPYRALAWAYLMLLVLLLFLNGKAYYTFGAYASLMAAGGLFWAVKLKHKVVWLLPVFALNFIIIPYGLPLFQVDTMQKYGVYMRDHYGLSSALRWEDGSIRDLGQDYADMHGWEEMVAEVAAFYHELSPAEKAQTMLYAGNYGQAGALTFYREKYDLPEALCFNASFIFWVPEDVNFTDQLAVEDNYLPRSNYFDTVTLIDSTLTPFARERQYIHYRTAPNTDVGKAWKSIVRNQREERLGISVTEE